jgi:tellurite resistance protein TehA-like permease
MTGETQRAADHRTAGRRPGAGVADLSPACFGLVMATGIVSLAAHLQGLPRIALGLFVLNVAAYVVLWLLTVWRVVRHPRRVLGDIIDHVRGPGFFTLVAATSLVGSQFVVLAARNRAGELLCIVAIVLWIALTYTIFAAFTVKARKPTLEQGIGGGWLLAVVATQSIAVLGALLAGHGDEVGKRALAFLALALWLWGGVLYMWMMSLIFYRFTFFPLAPADLAPPYWINMGAMAISTLAGALLVVDAPEVPFLATMLPFVRGFTVLYWATGTWWIPMLVALVVWRHVYRRFPFEYDASWWAAVFPLGMYAAATHEMNAAMGFDFLGWLPPLFLDIALAAWTVAFVGLALHLLRRMGARPS